MDYSGRPPGDQHIPAAVVEAAAGEAITPVWLNEAGGVTFQLGAGPGRRFAKWTPAGSHIDLGRERARLHWAAPFVTVPAVLDEGADGEGTWFVTAGLPGESAVADRWLADPAAAVAAIGSGLRKFHEALPVEECPFSWSAEARLADIRGRAAAGLIDPAGWHPDHGGVGSVARALELLADIPPTDVAVVCHGDTCAPNTLLAADGSFSGHVDLGSLGVADRWADLAIATWSTTWNYGPGWEEPLLEAYGVAPDPERTRYYRLLWDLGP